MTSDDSNVEDIWRLVDHKKEAFYDLSDKVWDTPELGYLEYKSVASHIDVLEKEGFRITRNVAGIETAVMGEAGEEGPVIALLGEFDALPGLSQKAGLAEMCELKPGGNGHGCGHHLLGAGAMLAAAAVKDFLAANNLKGRVRYYGCPAEENGSGKGFMVRSGAFDDVDIALSWHPHCFNMVIPANSLANIDVRFSFIGRSAHASAAPHLGRSALDGVELMNVGVNYMREHMPSSARVHYAIVDAGGTAANVVQARAEVSYLIRAETQSEVRELFERVRKIAQGAALMTETSVKEEIHSGDANLLGNRPLDEAMLANMIRLGGPHFAPEDHALAQRFQSVCDQVDIASAYEGCGIERRSDEALSADVQPLLTSKGTAFGSTDVGDVSWTTPTAQVGAACFAIGTPFHSWQLVAQGKSDIAHKGMAFAAKVMAGTAVDVLTQPDLLAAAKQDFLRRTGGKSFVSLVPASVRPTA